MRRFLSMLLVILALGAVGVVISADLTADDHPWLGALLVVALAPVGFASALWAGTVWSPLTAVAAVPIFLLAHEYLTARRYRLPPDAGLLWVSLFFLVSAATGALAARPYLARGGRRRRHNA